MNKTPSLDQIPANRRLIEELYSHGKISHDAREYALNLLHPADRWGIWISRLLVTIGSALLLCGIVYFFAFNWARISPAVKLSSIQISMIACLIGAYVYSLERMSGQLCLLSATVLTGVFMAVFGQIYQTGADAYQLFMMWSILTLGWTLVSNFAPQWTLWLVITNAFLILWWNQGALPTREMEFMLFLYLMLLNGSALALREYFASCKNYPWLKRKWTRVILIIATLVMMLIPIIALIADPGRATLSMILSAMAGLVGHGVAYLVYRFRLQDMWSLSATVLSGCIVVEVAGFRLLLELSPGLDAVAFLMMGLMTLGLFTYAIVYLRETAKIMESDGV